MRLFILLLFFAISSYHVSYSQCESSIKLTKVTKANEDTKTGAIEIQVNSPRQYSLQLIACKGTEMTVIKEEKGEGENEYKFDGLDAGFIYRVMVKFDEKEFLCSNKVLDNIILKEN